MSRRECAIWIVRLVQLFAMYYLIIHFIDDVTFATPLTAASLNTVVLVMVMIMISHVLIVISKLSPQRKKQLPSPAYLATSISGHALAFVVALGLSYYLYTGSGPALFTFCFVGLLMHIGSEYASIVCQPPNDPS